MSLPPIVSRTGVRVWHHTGDSVRGRVDEGEVERVSCGVRTILWVHHLGMYAYLEVLALRIHDLTYVHALYTTM